MEPAPFDLADLSASHEAMGEARVEAGQRAEMERAKRSFWRELPILMVAALIIAMLIKTFLFQAFFIPSGSMQDTLDINDRVLVSKQAFRISEIERYDVLVFDAPNGGEARSENLLQAFVRNVAESLGLSTPRTEFIKRVIGLPGDEVEIQGNRVLVNGVPITEPYLRQGVEMRTMESVTVSDGQVWVMGDNRNISDDSRSFGPIEIESIVGRAVAIIWPPSRWGGL